MTDYLIASDLDRTVLPNGPQDESPQARPLLHVLARHPQVRLAYVSGRDHFLVEQAIADYDLPQPDFAITDVGTTIYRVSDGDWQEWRAWADRIATDWQGYSGPQLAALLSDLPDLSLQEQSKQGRAKLSYYVPLSVDEQAMMKIIHRRLVGQSIQASLIWSVDEPRHIGLLDILPAQANKLRALEFLREQLQIPLARTVFAGDSGNDLLVLTSEISSILVANAAAAVVSEAWRQLPAGRSSSLYHARGGFLGMNGYYAAGVLEGVNYFFPELGDYLQRAAARQQID